MLFLVWFWESGVISTIVVPPPRREHRTRGAFIYNTVITINMCLQLICVVPSVGLGNEYHSALCTCVLVMA